ncbi:actin-like protein arp8, partial [Coemansia aciculifera]
MSSITASVRDALVMEHAHTSHYSSPSQAQLSSKNQRSNQNADHLSRIYGERNGLGSSGEAGGYQNGSHLGRIDSNYSFPTYAPLNIRNAGSSLRRNDRGVGSAVDYLNRGLNVTTGENVIVLHAGSRWMRVGRASDAVPKELPHAIARRFKHTAPKPKPELSGMNSAAVASDDSHASAAGVDVSEREIIDDLLPAGVDNTSTVPPASESTRMDIDEDAAAVAPQESQAESKSDEIAASNKSDSDNESESDRVEPKLTDSVDKTLSMLREALKQHQRHSKRKLPANAYAQVLTYNKQSRPEIIQDHNDPFKIDWIV